MAKNQPGQKFVEAMESALNGTTVPPMVYVPPTINGKRTLIQRENHRMPSVKAQIVRIHEEADPIGFLMAVQRGDMFKEHIVTKTGEIIEIPFSPPMKYRVIAAKYLADKVMPRLGVVRHIIDKEEDGGKDKDPRSFDKIVEAVSRRISEHKTQLPALAPVTVIENEQD